MGGVLRKEEIAWFTKCSLMSKDILGPKVVDFTISTIKIYI